MSIFRDLKSMTHVCSSSSSSGRKEGDFDAGGSLIPPSINDAFVDPHGVLKSSEAVYFSTLLIRFVMIGFAWSKTVSDI